MTFRTKRKLFLSLFSILSLMPILFISFSQFNTSLGETGQNLRVVIGVLFLVSSTLLILAVWIGEFFSHRSGLRFDLIDRFLSIATFNRKTDHQEISHSPTQKKRNTLHITNLFLLSVLISLATTLFITLFIFIANLFADTTIPILPEKSLVYLVFSTLYQSIAGEIIFRLFVMSLVVSLFLSFKFPRNYAFPLAIFITAAIASWLSFPSVYHEFVTPTLLIQLKLFLVGIVPHVVFGYIFWKKSFLYAIFTHAFTFACINLIVGSLFHIQLLS